MKKKRLAAGALALAVSVTACGCGDQIYEMTAEEEAVIVHYSAHAVSKFNKKQSEGVQDVAVIKALRELREKEAEERRKQREEEEKERQEKLKNAESESGEQKEQTTSPSGGQTNLPSGEQNTGSQVQYVSLKQALKLSGVNAVYRGHELVSAYQASQSYMVRANSGYDLLVLHVNLKNGTDRTAECDILSSMPSFRLTVNGEVSVTADTTILLNDLGTYQGRIRAGEKARTVLIFQLKKGAVRSIDSMDLEVAIGGTTSLVQLTN